MISHQNTLISEELIEKHFVCNLNKCKGACCVAGDSGAPLEHKELAILKEIYPQVEPYLNQKGKEAIAKSGVYVTDFEGDKTTPCVDDNKECAYVVFDNDVAKCGIEQAYLDGKITFRKPISCHLYPIRITQYPEFDVLNYDKWTICSPACAFGEELQVPVYRFLKDPLIRKYGVQWYNELEEMYS